MKISKLIKRLKKIEKDLGDVEVSAGAWCGTNNGYIHFDIRPDTFKGKSSQHLNGRGEVVIDISVSETTKEDILKGIKDMEKLGYTYYRSQFVLFGKYPTSGISPCEWHNLW